MKRSKRLKTRIWIKGQYLTAKQAAKKVNKGELTTDDVLGAWLKKYTDDLKDK